MRTHSSLFSPAARDSVHMPVEVPKVVQSAVVALYGSVLRQPFERFKEETLRSLNTLLPFSSAVWGSGVHSTNTMLSLTLVDQPPEMLMAYARDWQAQDFCRAAAVASPGRAFRHQDLGGIEHYRSTAIYQQFSRSWGMEHTLAIVHADDATDLAEIICLFRADREKAFTTEERALLEHFAPHLAAAWGMAQTAHYQRRASTAEAIGVPDPSHYAIADGGGIVHAAGAAFCEATLTIMPRWKGPVLPDELLPLAQGRQDTITLGRTEFRRHLSAHRTILTAMPVGKPMGLTPAELRAVRLYVDGLARAEIAERLGISDATVRNQLAAAYRKLQVRSRTDLIRRISFQESVR